MRSSWGCINRQCFGVYRQCFDHDGVIFGRGQGWMSQRGCGRPWPRRYRYRVGHRVAPEKRGGMGQPRMARGVVGAVAGNVSHRVAARPLLSSHLRSVAGWHLQTRVGDTSPNVARCPPRFSWRAARPSFSDRGEPNRAQDGACPKVIADWPVFPDRRRACRTRSRYPLHCSKSA